MAMTLLQVKIDVSLKKAIQQKAQQYGVTSSSLVKITLAKAFLESSQGDAFDDLTPGNVFNADRDNGGKGIAVEDFINLLEKYDRSDRKVSTETKSKNQKKSPL